MSPPIALLFAAPVFMASGTDFKSEYMFEFDIASHQVSESAGALIARKLEFETVHGKAKIVTMVNSWSK